MNEATSSSCSKLADIVHPATLLVILLVAGPLAVHIPMATLAGILLVVAWHMGEWHSFVWLARGPRNDAAVLLTTFGFTVMADLTIGIGMGIALAALLFVQQMTTATQVITGEDEDDSDAVVLRAWLPAGVQLLEVRGPLFFGGAETLRRALDVLPEQAKLLLIDLTAAPGLDATTARIPRDFASRSQERQTRVSFVTRDAATATALRREGLERALGVERAVERWRGGA